MESKTGKYGLQDELTAKMHSEFTVHFACSLPEWRYNISHFLCLPFDLMLFSAVDRRLFYNKKGETLRHKRKGK